MNRVLGAVSTLPILAACASFEIVPGDGGAPGGTGTGGGGGGSGTGGTMAASGGGGGLPDCCSDGTQNGEETDVDCGGPVCGPTCAVDWACSGGDDCASGRCGPTDTCTRWATSVGGTVDIDGLVAADFDADGNLYVAGRNVSDVSVGGLDDTGTSHTGLGGADVVVVKYAPDGKRLWSKLVGGPGEDAPTALDVAPNGDLVLCGYHEAGASFGGPVLGVGANGHDAFVVEIRERRRAPMVEELRLVQPGARDRGAIRCEWGRDRRGLLRVDVDHLDERTRLHGNQRCGRQRGHAGGEAVRW